MGLVIAVAASAKHEFSKSLCQQIYLEHGLGARGDCHSGVTVQHLSRIAADPTQPNLRQVHLIHSELFARLLNEGFQISPGDLGENITTKGIDLLGLPRSTVLKIGQMAEIELTGLRNPCAQIEKFRTGLLSKVVFKRPDGSLERKTGVMGVVRSSGAVLAGDKITIVLPEGPHMPLERV